MFYRETRFQLDQEKTSVQIDDIQQSGTIIDVSHWGVRINFKEESDLVISRNIHLKLFVKDYEIFVGSASVLSNNKSPKNGSDVSFRLLGAGANIPYLQAILNRDTKTTEIFESNNEIDGQYKIRISDFVFLLQTIKNELEAEEIENGIKSDDYESKVAVDKLSIDQAIINYGAKLSKAFNEVGELSRIGTENSSLYRSYFQIIAHPFMLTAPFVERAYKKPLNYAGDYGLMAMLYQYEDIGRSLFARFLHRWSCDEPAAVANKNRVVLLKEILLEESKTKHNFKISVVACGPCREIELFFDSLIMSNSKLKVDAICLDQEEKALDYARARIFPKISNHQNLKVRFMSDDGVLGFIKKKDVLLNNTAKSDVIISAGLFDYLSDRLASKLISRLYDQLDIGGLLIIGNVSKSNPCVFSMSYVTEWELVLRSPQDLIALVSREIIENSKHIEVIQEPIGVNLFLMIRK